ncbi:MAG: transposase [Gammaproteobacteria bacterium]|nr:transposase [Gammaproteobacteria bacterium]MDE0274231.1 transposase [Gammaproteobacteria bacterium]
MPPETVEGIRRVLRGGVVLDSPHEAFAVRRSLPHGHVAAVLGLCRGLGLPRLLHRTAGRTRDLALAAVVARVLSPASKLATARQLSPGTAASSLGAVLGLGEVSGNEVLDMLDWLLQRQPWIERSLARRHLKDGTLVLYDMTSSYLEGRCCPLAKFGHSRDGRRGRRQVAIGLLCAGDGCPIAVEAFEGNTADPGTVAAQVAKLKGRFSVKRIALVGDRGMLTTARIRKTVAPAGLDWISALKTADLRKLLKPPKDGGPAPLRPDGLQPDAVAEILSPDFPGERLMVCFNPRLAEERARKREALLKDTEAILGRIADIVRRKGSKLRGAERINRRVGREANRRKVEKHFDIAVADDRLTFERNAARIAAEARLDGIYIVRTSLDADAIGAHEAVAAYKSLARVERAFRNLKTARLKVRPMYVYSEGRVRAHVFLCALACHVEWRLRRLLAPMLFEDDDPEGARAQRDSPVKLAKASERARRKSASKTTADGLPAHSLTTLLDDLATLALNTVQLPGSPESRFFVATQPTPLQRKAFELLDVDPAKMFPVRVQAE